MAHLLVSEKDMLQGFLRRKTLLYIAEISYALYVIHPITMLGWMGSGDTLVRYAKRIICFALTFSLAHLSSRTYEKFFIEVGKSLAERWTRWRTTVGQSCEKEIFTPATAVASGRRYRPR